VDIDTPLDFFMAEKIYKHIRVNEEKIS